MVNAQVLRSRLFRNLAALPLLIYLGACVGSLGQKSDKDQANGGDDACTFDGVTYDCEALDRCTEDSFDYRLACCQCDPALCNPDPDCPGDPAPNVAASSCMSCHNASSKEDYAGAGLSNPHPFKGAAYLSCVSCHGGNPQGTTKELSHVPAPPAIGGEAQQLVSPFAYFNRLTLTGLDKLGPYSANGTPYTALDYLQFVNPGDLRVVSDGRSCGKSSCHKSEHVDWVTKMPIATESGFFSGTLYSIGVENGIPEHRGLYEDTAAEYGFRAVSDSDFPYDPNDIGLVQRLMEFPERAQYGNTSGIYKNPAYDVNLLASSMYTALDDPTKSNRVKANSPLATLAAEQVAVTCGDCHLGSAGQNNRYADFRSSGCTACHMQYAPDGRSRSTDYNINHNEPANPDAIAAPERPHPATHQIRSVAKILPRGGFMRGIDDYACAGCHQGSNRTVLQYWGIRLDQNNDLDSGLQYPANPVSYLDAENNPLLFDPKVGNQTFNGRNKDQLIVFEDYDGDGRDDTPPDVHFEAGLGCIDCHGSRDAHAGAKGDTTGGKIASRESQATAIECESCHGGVDDYARTVPCETYSGAIAKCVADRAGNAVRNVVEDSSGNYWLTSRVTGKSHFVRQTKDAIVQNGKKHPQTGEYLYSAAASYAMGRADGNPATGIGPVQNDPTKVGAKFAHSDTMECVSCHSSWTNNCVGCHASNEYNDDPNQFFFSNITGERIVVNQNIAAFTYITPVPMSLGVGASGRITQTAPGMKMFLRYTDLNGNESEVLAFTDRNGNGNNPGVGGRGDFGALAHNKIMPHSIRGKVTAKNEGPRYCVACHLTQESVNKWGSAYQAFRTALDNGDFAKLDWNLLAEHIGKNPGNQLNSPFWVQMVVGLGTGLFLFDANGCPVNPLDRRANHEGCNDAPANTYDPANVVYNLDRVVEPSGVANASNSHPMLNGLPSPLRDGARYPKLAGPFGARLLRRLADPAVGLILDSYLDADGRGTGRAKSYQ